MDGDRNDRDYPQSSSVYSDAYYRQAPSGRSAYGYRPAQCYAYTDEIQPADQKKRGGRAAAVLLLAAVVLAALFMILFRGGILWRMEHDKDTADAAEREQLYPTLAEEETSGGFTLVQSSAAALDPLDPRDIYAAACPGTVGVTSRGYAYNIFGQLGMYAVTGSGIVLTEDGYILTNFRVIQGAYEMGAPIQILTAEGASYDAEVVGIESDSDLAVLKADADGLVPAALGDSGELTVGQPIYALGNPLGELTFTMTRGIISALDRRIATEDGAAADMFQFDAAVNRGDYGGPVLNDRGQVVGVISARLTGVGTEGLNFAVPVNDACRIAQELIRSGYVPGKAYLGLRLSDVTASVARYYGMEQGAYVHSVRAGSCAETAGIQSGDIIIAIDGVEVSSVAELTAVIRNYRAGDSADITVLRDEGYVTVTVTFDEELPAERMTDAEASRREGRFIPSGQD